MYTTLKLYYLHQQELLNQVLAILKEHVHSRQLASTLFTYVKQMHGANFKWVSQIEALLKSHINLGQTDMYKLIHHHELVHQLHTIVHHAAVHHHAMIHRMFHVMKRTGFVHRHRHLILRTHRKLVTGAKRILHRVNKVFTKTHKHTTTRTVTTHHRVVVTKTLRHSFRTSASAHKTLTVMLKKHTRSDAMKALKTMLAKAKTKATIKNLENAIKKVAKK